MGEFYAMIMEGRPAVERQWPAAGVSTASVTDHLAAAIALSQARPSSFATVPMGMNNLRGWACKGRKP